MKDDAKASLNKSWKDSILFWPAYRLLKGWHDIEKRVIVSKNFNF